MSHSIPKPDCWYGDWLRPTKPLPWHSVPPEANFRGPPPASFVLTRAVSVLKKVCEEPYAPVE